MLGVKCRKIIGFSHTYTQHIYLERSLWTAVLTVCVAKADFLFSLYLNINVEVMGLVSMWHFPELKFKQLLRHYPTILFCFGLLKPATLFLPVVC